MTRRVVLASGSPRRRELLAALIADFDVVASNVDEPPVTGDPIFGAMQLASAKAVAVATDNPEAIVIGADTVVHDGLRDLGKPATEAEAADMLRHLRAREHRVITGVMVVGRDAVTAIASISSVTLADMDDAAIDAYVASGRPMDKAGAYAIQDDDVPTVDHMSGCYCGVMGLPLWKVRALLIETGVDAADPSLTYPRCADCPERPTGHPPA